VETPWAKSDIIIGSLVRDRRHPQLDPIPPEDNVIQEASDVSKVEDRDFSAQLDNAHGASLAAAFTKLLKSDFPSESSSGTSIEARTAYLHVLKWPRKVFKAVCHNEEIQQILEEDSLNKKSWYFILG
jgi:hypothetical protein